MINLQKVFCEMLEIDTTNSKQNETEFINYVTNILDEYDIDYNVYSKNKRANLVATINEGASKKYALISHCDVAETANQKWTYPPFEVTKIEDKIYARGTLDTKHLCAIHLKILLELKKENFNSEVKLIITADEENGSVDGMEFLSKQINISDYIILNEGGGFCLENSKLMTITTGEKTRCELKLKSANHSGNDLLTLFTNVETLNDKLLGNKSDELKAISPTLDAMIKYNNTNNFSFNNYVINEDEIEVDLLVQFLASQSENDINEVLAQVIKGTDFSIDITSFNQGFNYDDQKLYTLIEQIVRGSGLSEYKLFTTYALGNTDGRFLNDNNVILGFSPLLEDIPLEKVTSLIHQSDEYITVSSLNFCYDVLKKLIIDCEVNYEKR